jgi:hypothetical protein
MIPNHQEEVMMISQEDEIPTNLYNNNTGRNDRNVINPDQH